MLRRTRVLAAAARDGEPLALLGMGSNVLVADHGFPGYVVRLEGEFLRISDEDMRKAVDEMTELALHTVTA